MRTGRKKEYFICSIAEVKTLEIYFSQMAAKGWLIDKINLFSLEFRAVEPRELQFIVDILPQITAFDYPNNDDAMEYRRICEESGWIFALSSKQLHVFYAEKSDKPVPIHTDQRIEAQIMLKTCRKYELPFFLIALVYMWLAWGGIIGKGYGMFLTNTSIAQPVAAIIFTGPFLWYLGFILVWHFRTMSRIKKGLPLLKSSWKFTRIRGKSLAAVGIIVIIVMLVGVVLDVFGGAPAVVLIVIALPFGGFFIGLFMRKRIDTIKRGKKENIIMFALGIAAVVILSVGSMIFIISNLGNSLSYTKPLPENRQALRLKDFGVKTPVDIYNYYSKDSIAVPQNYTYYEISTGGSVRTDMQKTIHSFLAHKLFEIQVAELHKQEWRSITEMSPAEADSWGAKKGYYINAFETEILLLYDRTILRLDFDGKNIPAVKVQEQARVMGY